MDFAQIKLELLETFLHGKSTLEVSHKLGYSFDQVKRWLAGTKELRWDEFCDLCAVLDIPLPLTLATVFTYEVLDCEDQYFFLAHFRQKYVTQSQRELYEILGVHPSVMKRYFRSQVFPSLELVLAMINLRPNLLGSFLLMLVGTKTLSPLHARFHQSQSHIQSETLWPLSSAIEGLLVIQEYKQQTTHDEMWFCRRLGVSLAVFQKVWAELIQSGKVVPDGNKFKITYETINLNGATPYQVCKIAEFWTERAKLRLLSPDHKPVNKEKKPNFLAYRIVPMTAETMKKSTEILLKAYQDICDLAVADEGGNHEDVRILLLHHFSVSDFPKNPLATLQDDPVYESEPLSSNL